MKKLFILGAGIYQVPLIKKAKEMGLYTIVASCPGSYPGLALADQVYFIDTTDQELLLKTAIAEQISGVCTTGTDVAVRSLGYVCEKMKLPGISARSAAILTDKAAMKKCFIKGGVRTPAGYQVFSSEEARRAYQSLSVPVIVKAVDSSGSRGITKVGHLSQLDEAYRSARAVTKKDYILVEEFIEGHEIGVDGFVSHGKAVLLLPHNKFTHTVNGTTLPEGHHFPYHCSDALHQEILQQMERVVRSSGMNHCAVNADLLIRGKEVFVLEAGGRAGATCIPELISIHKGLDYYEQLIRSSLGETPDFSGKFRKPCMAKLLFSKKTGTITDIDTSYLSGLANRGISVSLDFQTGDPISEVRNGTDRIGQVIMETDKEDVFDRILTDIRKRIKIDGETLEKLWNE